jgi:Phospholipase B
MSVKNGICYEKNGWLYVSVKGGAKERGYAYGYLIAKEMKKVKEMLDFSIYNSTGRKWEYFVEACKEHITPTIKQHFKEFYDEMDGFSKGCTAAGTKISLDEVIAWNNIFTVVDGWYPHLSGEGIMGSREGGARDRCSAFIATGDYTKDGKIVCAHNNFSEFLDGQYARVVLDLNPTKGARILMLGFAGWIWSGTDFFVTSNGIIGTETTIGGFNKYENNYPISCRIRQAMQYGKTLDDYVRILVKENSGDYANSWLFGDINTNEIMCLELGLKYHDVKRTKNGVFIGFNAPYDPRIRNLECSNTGMDDIRRHQGARKVRLGDLMEKYKGRITSDVAKKIISDHHDVYLHKNNPCSRTVCSHYELDAREYMSDPSRPKPFQPRGAVDGNVCDSNMAKNMTFLARWGSSCGTPFYKDKFCNKNKQWDYLRPYLNDRPSQPWTYFSITDTKKPKLHVSRKQENKKTMKNKTRKIK